MPRYFASLWRWLREQLDPTLPPAPVLRDTPTPAPTARLLVPPPRVVPCPFCAAPVGVGVIHQCGAFEGFRGEGV